MPRNLKEKKDETVGNYKPEGEELDVKKYLERRIEVLKKTKKNILGGFDFEQVMKEADREYQPRSLRERDQKKFMFVQDEIKGLRGSRTVPITGKEGEEWRSDVSEPLLMVKIQTALSILVNQNPEAVFKATTNKYKRSTQLAYSLWKRSWNIGRAKHQLKLFVFDLAKYGWAVGHTYPRVVKRKGQILTELDLNNPENNKYKERDIVEFNDIYREKLDPYRTWIDDMTNLTDPFSTDDWYYEKDYSKDTFDREFGDYSNSDLIKSSSPELSKNDDINTNPNEETNKRTDLITVGFYESKNKDLYAIWIPRQKVVLYHSPLPNDDKKLSCWWTYWNERDPRTPYGIGLYEMIKHDKVLYDRMMNMSVDQLVMAIYPMLFFSGANRQPGDGTLMISPGLLKEKLPGTTIEQIKIDFDKRGFDAVSYMAERMDENTGITPTLQGEIEGKTLGQTLHAKDAALKRLNIPLANISQALEEEAYISLSWMNQVYSTPEVLEFESMEDLLEYSKEVDKQPVSTKAEIDGNGNIKKVIADFLPVLDLDLDQDREGTPIESPDSRFFRLGVDIKTTDIKWEGRINVQPQSILSPSIELDRQRKLELYNIVTPIVQLMAQSMAQGQPQMALALYKPTEQILEVQDEKPENWLPDDVILLARNPEARASALNPLFVQGQTPPGEAPAEGASPEQNPQAGDTVVPRDEVSNPARDSLESSDNYSANPPMM